MQGKIKTLAAADISLFCAQVALILKSGIPLYDGISALCESGADDESRAVFRQIDETVKATGSLYEALKDVKIFPGYMVNMIHIGEKSGKLEDVMESLSRYYDSEDKLKKSIKSAVLYPAILLVMMVVVIAVLVVKVLPIFDQVFRTLGTEASPSATIMNIGIIAGQVALILVLAVLVVVLAMFLYSRTKSGSVRFAGFSSRFFLTRKLSEKIAAGRFASATAMMLSSGYDMDQALELIPDIIDNPVVVQKVERCKELLGEGTSFADAVVRAGIFSGVYAKMIGIGFQTGALDTVMRKLAAIYEDEIDDTVSKMVSVIEPTIVAVLSVIIGIILLAVMLPLMGIMSSIG